MQPSLDEYTRMVTDLTEHDFSENQSTGLVTLVTRLFAKEREHFDAMQEKNKQYFERIRREDKEDRQRIREEDRQEHERTREEFLRIRAENKQEHENTREEFLRIRAEDKQDRERIRAEDKQDRTTMRTWMIATLTSLVFAGLAAAGAVIVLLMQGPT